MDERSKGSIEFMIRLSQAKRVGGGGLALVGFIQGPQNPGFETGSTALLRSDSGGSGGAHSNAARAQHRGHPAALSGAAADFRGPARRRKQTF